MMQDAASLSTVMYAMEQAEKRVQSQIDYLERKVNSLERTVSSLQNDIYDLERKVS